MGILLNRSKNYIINGACDFAQRTLSAAAAANNTFIVDRFKYQKSGTMVHTISRDTDVPTATQAGYTLPYSMRLNLTTPQASLTTNQRVQILQVIEGQVFAPLKNKNMCLSFWVKATLPGTYCIALNDSSASATYVSEYVINAANTWEKKSISILHSDALGSWNYTTGAGLQVRFTIASGPDERTSSLNTWLLGDFKSSTNQINGVQTGATDFRIAGIQLEESTTPSNFERAGGNITQELQLCQRYYEKSYDPDVTPGTITINGRVFWQGASSGGNGGAISCPFRVIKRIIPTGRVYSPESGVIDKIRGNAGDINGQINEISISSICGSMATGATWINMGYQWTADAEL